MRLIDADALRAAVMKILNNSVGGAYDGVYQCLEAIDNAPTVCNDNYSMGYQDGVKKVLSERLHGEWIDRSEDEGYVECPICNHLTNCDGNIDKLNYCWKCGAYMRKEIRK